MYAARMATKPLSDEEAAAIQADIAKGPRSLAEDYNPKRDVQATFQGGAEACANEILRIALRGENDPIRFKASVYVVERVTGRLQDQAPPLVDDKWAQFLASPSTIVADDHDEFAEDRIPSPAEVLTVQAQVRKVVPDHVKAIAEANRVRPPSPPSNPEDGVENDSHTLIADQGEVISTNPVDVPPSMLMPTSYLTDGKDS